MKAIKLILLLLFLLSSVQGYSNREITFVNLNYAKKKSSTGKDTSEINRITLEGFKLLSKKDGAGKLKEYTDSAVLICEKRNIEIPALLHLLIAEYHYSTADFRSAFEEATIAMDLSTGSGESDVLAKVYAFLGRYYHATGFYKESIEYYGKAIEISREIGLKGVITRCYWGQAMVFNTITDISGYRQNLKLLIDAGFEENDSSSSALGYYRLGTSFCGDSATAVYRDYKMADSILKEGLKISIIKKDTGFIASILSNTGWNFYLEEVYDSALFYYERSLKYSLPAKLYSASANSLGNIGTILRDLKDTEKSLKYYRKGIEQANYGNDLYDKWWIYRDMSELYLRSNDTSNAYINFVLFKKFSDQYMTNLSSEGLASAKLRYEADSHNKEVELLSLRLKNNRLLNYGFTALIILTIIIGYLILRASSHKNKRRISEMNRKISEITQANLRQQMNPHFVFNTLNSIQYYMYQHDKLSTNNYLTKFSNLMRRVLDNSQHTSVPLNDELSALKLYLELECIRFKDKFEFEINVDEEIDPLMYKVPTMLIQPYVENSISHGLMPKDGKGFVKVNIDLKQDHLLCTIEDNGIGREASRERNIKKESNHNSLGTQITSSRLDLVNALYGTTLKTIYTDLKNENGEAVGTRVEIHIPIIS